MICGSTVQAIFVGFLRLAKILQKPTSQMLDRDAVASSYSILILCFAQNFFFKSKEDLSRFYIQARATIQDVACSTSFPEGGLRIIIENKNITCYIFENNNLYFFCLATHETKQIIFLEII